VTWVRECSASKPRMSTRNPGLTLDTLFVAITRRRCVGVTYSALLFNAVFVMKYFC